MDQIKSAFAQPNVVFWINEPVVQEVVSRRVSKCESVTDCILGTSITGQACLNGNVSANLVPAQGMVRLQVSLTGQIHSNNVGYNKPVRLITSGDAGVCATRMMNISESGITYEPVFAQAKLRTQIHSIQHRFRIVRRIAWKKARESKPQADRIAVGHLQQKIEQGFDKSTREAGAIKSPPVLQKILPMLRRLDMPEPPRYLSSTDTAVVLQSRIGPSEELAAPTPAPSVRGSYDGAIQIHESAINSSLGRFLAGRTVTEKELRELAKRMEKIKPGSAAAPTPSSDKSEKKSKPKKLTIKFDSVRPLIFEARDNRLRIGIQGKFTSGKRSATIKFTATYKPVKTADGATVLMRDGELKIDFPTERSGNTKVAMRQAIKSTMANPFPKWLLDQPINVPADNKVKAIAGRSYRIRTLSTENGWLTATLY